MSSPRIPNHTGSGRIHRSWIRLEPRAAAGGTDLFAIDHVIVAVQDLEQTARELRSVYGLGSLEGGRHPGGTVNRFIPVGGTQYLELLALDGSADHDDEAMEITARLGTRSWRLFAWALTSDTFDADVDRLSIDVENGSITSDDGKTGTWRTARLGGDPGSNWEEPFLIDYGDDRSDSFARSYIEAGHSSLPDGFAWIEVAGLEGSTTRLLDSSSVPLRIAAGEPGVRACGIKLRNGAAIELRSD